MYFTSILFSSSHFMIHLNLLSNHFDKKHCATHIKHLYKINYTGFKNKFYLFDIFCINLSKSIFDFFKIVNIFFSNFSFKFRQASLFSYTKVYLKTKNSQVNESKKRNEYYIWEPKTES